MGFARKRAQPIHFKDRPMFEKPSVGDLREAAQKLGMTPSDAYLAAVEEIVTPLANAYPALDATPDELPPVKSAPREFYRPTAAENPHGAWYVKTAIKGKAGGKLAGRRVALKDNICLAGVPMMIGAELFDGYVPEVDATWSSAFSMPAARSRARLCANISACRAAATRARAVRCIIRASAASAPADPPRVARRLSPRAKSRWRSAATRPARSASRRAIAASSA